MDTGIVSEPESLPAEEADTIHEAALTFIPAPSENRPNPLAVLPLTLAASDGILGNFLEGPRWQLPRVNGQSLLARAASARPFERSCLTAAERVVAAIRHIPSLTKHAAVAAESASPIMPTTEGI